MIRREFLKLGALVALPFPSFIPEKPVNIGLQHQYGGLFFTRQALREKTFPHNLANEVHALGRSWKDSLRKCYERNWEPTVNYDQTYKLNRWPSPIIYPGRKKNGLEKPIVLPGTIGVVGELPEECYKVSAYPVAAGIMNADGNTWWRKQDSDEYRTYFYLYLNVVKGLHPHAILPDHIPAWLDSQIEILLEHAPR